MVDASSTALQDAPVFVVGSGRCGSTLLQAIINSNPSFLIWGEHNGFLRMISDAYFKANDAIMSRALNRGPLIERISRLRDRNSWSAWENPMNPECLVDNFRAFVRSLFRAQDATTIRWGFKEIRYARTASDRTLYFLCECFPRARFLILIRNPADTVFSSISSWSRQSVFSPQYIDTELRKFATTWAAQYKHLYLFHQVVGELSRVIRFEDLVHPENLASLWRFLGVSDTEGGQDVLTRVVDSCIKTDNFAKMIRARMERHAVDLERVTFEARRLYGYADWKLSTPTPSE